MFWTEFWKGLLLGISVAMPLGPTSTELMRRGLRDGLQAAWRVGLGAVTVDAAYFLLGLYGLAPALLRLHLLEWLLWPLLLGLLGYMAIASLRAALGPTARMTTGGAGGSGKSAYLYGLGLTLLNPLTILFWVAVAGGLQATRGGTGAGAAALLIGQVLGGLSWFTLLSILAAYLRRFLSAVFFRILSAVSGIILAGFFAWFLAVAFHAFP